MSENQQPSKDQLLNALEKAHLAGDTEGAKELARWHNELYQAQPEPEPEPQRRELNLQPDTGRKIADAGRRGPAPVSAPAPPARQPEPQRGPNGTTGSYAPQPQTGGATGSYDDRGQQVSAFEPTLWDRIKGIIPSNKDAAVMELEARKVAEEEGISIDQVYKNIGVSRPVFNPEGRPTVQALAEASEITAKELPDSIPGAVNTVLRTIRGDDESASDEGWLDLAISATEPDQPGNMDPNYQAFYGVGKSLGYSLSTMTASAIAAALSGLATANPAIAAGAAGAAGAAVAYRASRDEFIGRIKYLLDLQAKFIYGRKLNQDEWEKAYSEFDEAATKYGSWEAATEAVGNLIFLRAISAPLKGIGKQKAAEIAKRAASVWGSENVTETTTGVGQNRAELEAGLTDEELTVADAFRKQVIPTTIVTGLMGGAGAGVKAGVEATKSRERKIGEALDRAVDSSEFAPADQFATESLDPSRAQMEQVGTPQRPSMAELVSQKMKERGFDFTPQQGQMPPNVDVPLQPNIPPATAIPESEQEADDASSVGIGSQVTFNGKDETVADVMPHPDSGKAMVSFKSSPNRYVFASQTQQTATDAKSPKPNDLVDEEGRNRSPASQSVKEFKEKTGLGQDGVRALQKSIMEGQPITLEEAKNIEIKEKTRRDQERENYKNKDPDKDPVLKRERKEQAERNEYRDGVNIEPGIYKDKDLDATYEVTESGTVIDIGPNGERSGYGVITKNNVDEGGVAFASYVKRGIVNRQDQQPVDLQGAENLPPGGKTGQAADDITPQQSEMPGNVDVPLQPNIPPATAIPESEQEADDASSVGIGSQVTFNGKDETVADVMPHPDSGKAMVSFKSSPNRYVFASQTQQTATDAKEEVSIAAKGSNLPEKTEVDSSKDFSALQSRVDNINKEVDAERIRVKSESVTRAINNSQLNDQQKQELLRQLPEESTNEPTELDQPGQEPLAGAPAEVLPEPEETGDAGTDAETGSGENVSGGQPAGGRRVSTRRGVSDGEGKVPVSPGGTGERSTRQQRARDSERGNEDDGQDAGSGQPTTRGSEEAIDATEEAAETAPTSKGATTQRADPAGDRPAKFFTLTPEMNIGNGGAKTKFKNNIRAIETLKQLNEEGRQATPEEQQILAGYVGWGGIPQAFVGENGKITKGWEKEAKQLQEVMTDAEYEAARRSTQDAHYTSPEIVTEIWQAVKNMGFQGGRVLEPSVGTGNFLGFMPGGVRSKSSIAGVELDHITGGIAQKLYPGANIQAPLGFQEFTMPDGYFDLAIGNPPFGNQKLYDGKRKALSKMSIHNYFFAKSMAGLKPNGVLAMVVSSRLMDGNNKMARDYLAEQADLLGAVRLPNNAFLKNAGTEVTTDIIFLRKRREGEAPAGDSWSVVNTVQDAKGIDVPLNEYFSRNPGMMLGEWGAYGSMYGPNEPALVAKEGQDTNALLKEALASLPKGFMDKAGANPVPEEVAIPTNVEDVKVGSMFMDGDQISIRLEDEMGKARSEAVDVPSQKAEERVKGLIKVRDVFADLRKAQLTENVKDEALAALRDRLNRAYDQFVKKNGPINLDANKRLFRDDPTWPQLAALEESYDKGISATVAKRTGETPRKPSAEKAAIFRTRTQQPYKAPDKASTAKDAMTASLSEKGQVDMQYMAELYGKTESAIVDELGDLVFESSPNNWESRDEYLSGNVKQKLAMAERMAKDMPRLQKNVDALKEVQPEDIEAVDIKVKPGAHWLPPEVVTEFADHILGKASGKATYNPVMAKWSVRGEPTTAAANQYGTDRASVSDILTAAANDKSIVIRDRIDESTTVVNESATNAANEKIQRVKTEFRRWIWRDDARRERLTRLYNDTFNTDQLREYDGSHLTFPGKVSDDIVKLRPHQVNAAWRIVQSGTTLLDHVVGAGKTFTMIAGSMELRRTGRARKPMFVVPNHLVGQWAEDFTKLYPNANILAATKKDFEKGNRKRLFARIATGDWDAVIVAHSSFGKVEMDAEFQDRFIKQQIRDIDTAISTIRDQEGKGSRSIKQIEKQKERLEEKLKRLYDAENKDDNLTFGELGIDALFLDEAHEFKNLGFATSMTRVAGLGNPQGSQKAADMFMKVQSILERTGGNNVVFATGTPISNTMAEMYTMQRFLDYQMLQDQGIAHFDAWARMYGEVVTDWELSPTGNYKLNSRFSKFVNLPELMQRYLTFGDVINRDDINKQLAAQGKRLPVPKIKGGKPNNIVVERSEDQADYIGVPVKDDNGRETYPKGSLVYRAEHLPKKPEKGADNMLKIMSDARKAALDMRLIDPALYGDNPDSKINVAADRIKTLYDQWTADKGAQLVFIDLSTPKGAKAQEANRIRDLMQRAENGDEAASEQLDKMSPDEFEALDGDFSVYDDLRQKLIDKGIPESEIEYIHSANTEIQKAELFAKVRTGRVRVMMGSTAKMGAGMNVQTRLVALHHMDAPWRPSDLEQREGRIIRQGNELYERDPDGFEIEINRYATKQTLDSRMWQTIETKARFIEQVRKGNTKQREIEDLGAESANAAEMKAASSGNPLILEEMELRRKLRTLEQAEEEHDREQFRIRDAIRREKSIVERGKDRLLKYAQDVKKAKAAPKDFTMTVNGQKIDKQKVAGQEILAEANKMKNSGVESKAIGSYAGFDMTLDKVGDFVNNYMVTLQGAMEHQIQINDISLADPTGLTRKIINTISAIDAEAKQAAKRVSQAEKDLPQLEEQVGEWDQADELAKVKARHQLVIAELQPKKDPEPGQEDATSAMMSDMGADTPMPQWQPPYSMTGVPRRPDSDQFKIGDRTVKLKPEEKPTRREGIRFMLQDLIGKRIYFGKVRGKSKLGFYRSSNSEVRVKNYDDVEVMAHEMAHYLDMHYRYNKRFTREYKDSKYRKEVEALSYTSKKNLKAKEGFAEFVRLWLTNYSEAKARAPLFTQRFEEVMKDDAVLNRKMKRLQDEMHRWYLQGPRAQLRAKSGRELTAQQQILEYQNSYPLERYRQQVIDKIHAAKVVERTLKGEVGDAVVSPYKQFQMVNGAESVHEAVIKNGTPRLTDEGYYEFSGKGLNEIFKPASKHGWRRFDDLMEYFKARRGQELRKQGRENLFTEQEIDAGLSLGQKFPEFPQIFSEFQKFNDRMLEFYVDMGLIDESQRDAFKKMNQNYVPFHRVIERIEDGHEMGVSEIGRRLTGGTQNTKDIAENIVESIQTNIRAAIIARAKATLYNDIMDSQDGALFAARIAPDSKKVKVEQAQMASKMAEAMVEMGLTVSKDGMIMAGDPDAQITDVEDIAAILEENPGLLSFWTFGHKPQTTETYVDSAVVNGKRVYFEVHEPLLVEMLTGLRGLRSGAVMNALFRVKNLQTRTVTSMFQFLGPNAVRDTVSASIMSRNRFIPIYSTLKGMGHFMFNTQTYKDFRLQGGGYGTRIEARTQETRDRRRLDLPSESAWDAAAKLLAGWDRFTSAFEYGSRIGDYEVGVKSGTSPMEAAWEAREIATDFSKMGRNELWANFLRTVPFMNAGIQGLDKSARELVEMKGEMKGANFAKMTDKKAAFLMKGGVLTAMTAILWLLNHDDERYKQLTPDQKARFWWIFPPGADTPFKIPRPYDVGHIFGTLPEVGLDYMENRDGKEASEHLAWALVNTVGIGDYPGILQPWIEVQRNEKFTKAPVVPQFMMDLPAEYQYTDRTPIMYRKLGEYLGVSPLVAEHYSKGFLRYVEMIVADASEAALWKTDEWGPRPFNRGTPIDYMTHQFVGQKVPYRTKWTEGYWDLKVKAAAAQQTFNMLKREAIRNPSKAPDFASEKVNQILIGLNGAFSQVDSAFSDQQEIIASYKYNENMTAEEKEAKIESYYEQKNETLSKVYRQAKEALEQVHVEMP